MKHLRTMAAALCALAVATPALADGSDSAPASRWYITGFVGASSADEYDFSFVPTGGGADSPYEGSLESTTLAGGAIGWVKNSYMRLELEVASASYDFDDDYHSIGGGFSGLNENGSMDVTTVLANLWFNANMDELNLQPYIGVGLGVGFVSADLTISNGAGLQFDGDDTKFAGQIGAGVRVPLGDRFELDLSYRLRAVFDVHIGGAPAGFDTTSEDRMTHTAQLGLTYKF